MNVLNVIQDFYRKRLDATTVFFSKNKQVIRLISSVSKSFDGHK